MTMTRVTRVVLAAFAILSLETATAQQVPDPAFNPRLDQPAYPAGRGGGALLFIADHMPLAGHAEAMAAGSLAPGRIADGRGAGERVDVQRAAHGPNKRPMGMNAPEARDNQRFALNVMHWLTGVLK
jgi:hypothetical protein